MGEAAGASGASIAGLGLSAFSSIAKGEGTKSAFDMKADKAKRAAEFGRLQADLTDTTMRENLNTTLGNIDVIRAAGRIDPTSPTTAAIEDRQRMIAERQRSAALLTIRSQVAEDTADAEYFRKAGQYALDTSYLDAATGVLGGVAKAATAKTAAR
jgi:hypothetical protein